MACYGFLITLRVDPVCLGEFGEHVEVVAVGAQKDVAGEGGQGLEGSVEIGGDGGVTGGVAGCGDEAYVWVGGPSAYDDYVQSARAFVGLECPGGAALGVACCFMGGEGCAAKLDGIAIVQGAVDFCGGEAGESGVEIGSATALHRGDVAIHDHVPGVSFPEDLGGAGYVIVMDLAGEEDFDIRPLEA